MKDYITHRCPQLLEHNKKGSFPNCIRKIINPDETDKLLKYDLWNLYDLEDNYDYNTMYMTRSSTLVFCPYCGEKL